METPTTTSKALAYMGVEIFGILSDVKLGYYNFIYGWLSLSRVFFIHVHIREALPNYHWLLKLPMETPTTSPKAIANVGGEISLSLRVCV